jgi:excisionase family DNA binding protein
VTPEFDATRKKPYKTGELARLLEVSQRTVIRMIEEGEFGEPGKGWRWTKAGPTRGDRQVYVRSVKAYIERGP